MKTLIALTLAGLFACGTAFAADAKMTPQQEKMKTCNADAAGKTGDERKGFREDLPFRQAGQSGKQDGHVQQEDSGPQGRRTQKSAERVHEGLDLLPNSAG
jgi:psiF repeat.